MLKKIRIRNNMPQSATKSSAGKTPQVKTVEIFINKLDSHIAESYEKLRKTRQRAYNSINQSNYQNDSLRLEETFTKDNSTKFINLSRITNGTIKQRNQSKKYQSPIEQGQQNIALISNEEVTQYINLVYGLYNIPDPMQNLQKSKQKIGIQTAYKHTLAGTPVIRRNSASICKEKVILHRDIDLNINNNYSHRRQETAFDISLLSERSKEKIREYQSSDKKIRNLEGSPQTNVSRYQSLSKSYQFSHPTWTPQVFRYCFACEESVLEINLKHHEEECKLLQEAFNKSIEDILKMLQCKIDKLSREIQENIVQASGQKLLTQFNDLKKSVGNWMEDVRAVDKKVNPNGMRYKFNLIQERLGQSINRHLQALSKLHWFCRLRQNIAKKYSL